jgi:hypothetical protein
MYKTSDMGLSCALVSIGYEMKGIEWEGKKGVFTFKESKKLEEDIEDYWNRKLEVEPYDYFSNLKMLKSRLYER